MLVKVGKHYINVDDISNVVAIEGTLHIYFSGQALDACDTLHGDEARRLQAYLDTIACDLDEAEAIAEASKESTIDTLRDAGLMLAPTVFSPSAAQVWNAAQDAFRRIAAALSLQQMSGETFYAWQRVIEAEAAALPGAPTGTETQVMPFTSREISHSEFNDKLTAAVADGTAFEGLT